MAEVLVINVLAPQFYEDCHITDSINVPFEQLASFALTVPKDKTIVVYCARYECHASEQAYRDLLRMGFTHVYEYPGGIAEWYQKGYPTTGPAKEKYLHDPTRPHAGPADVKTVSAEHLKKMMTNRS